jgi:predicted nucleic acid-binding protein
MTVVALLDANVLYPAPLRDLLLQLAFMGLFRAHWSADIDDEWKRTLLSRRPELAKEIERTSALMRRAIPDAWVVGHRSRISGLTLPDPDDRHVLAAAIAAGAQQIVTYNTRDFPGTTLVRYGITACHPDTFLMSLADRMPMQVVAAVRACLARLTRPPLTPATYLSILRRIDLPDIAEFLDARQPEWKP